MAQTRQTYDSEPPVLEGVKGGAEGRQQSGGRARRLTDGFLQLQSHYCFAEHFCRVNRPNEKGVVEGTVKFARLKCLVLVPQAQDLEELNARLTDQCRQDLCRTLRGQKASKAVLLGQDQAAFSPLPQVSFDACRKVLTRACSLSLVRFDTNDYSVPTTYAHHDLLVKGYVDRVEVCCADQVIAQHQRCWGREEYCLEPLHYLALLERKPGALDYGRPFADWDLPECFAVLQARLEHEFGGEGTREYIRVLKLLADHSLADLARAIERSLRCNALVRDAIAQFLIPQEDWRHGTFRLDGREHLRQVQVAQTEVAAYAALMGGGGAP